MLSDSSTLNEAVRTSLKRITSCLCVVKVYQPVNVTLHATSHRLTEHVDITHYPYLYVSGYMEGVGCGGGSI